MTKKKKSVPEAAVEEKLLRGEVPRTGADAERFKDITRAQELHLIQRKRFVPESETAKTGKRAHGFRLKLNEDETFKLLQEVRKSLENIKAKRGEYGLAEEWAELRDLEDGIKKEREYSFEGAHNLHIHVCAMMMDVIHVKAAQNMFVRPMMLCKPRPGVEYDGDGIFEQLQLKETYMDYKVREEQELEEVEGPVIDDASVLGTGILKCMYVREAAPVRELLVYEGKRDVARFVVDFEGCKGDPQYSKNKTKLEADKTIEIWADYTRINYDGVRFGYVKLEDLYVDPDIPDIDRQPMVHELVTLTWSQVENFARTGFYDKDVVDRIKVKYEKDYREREYKVYETICTQTYFSLDSGESNPRKMVCTHVEEADEFLRTISFPYNHNHAYYIPFYTKRDPKSFYGKSMAKKIKPINDLVDDLWNDTCDGSQLRNLPMFKAKKESFDPSTKSPHPAIIYWLDDIKNLEKMDVGGISPEVLNLIARAERYAEWITGVTAYMTGRESPTDPQAPMGKAYLLLKESNLRVNRIIKSLNISNKRVYQQAESLMYQFDASRDVYVTVDGKTAKKTLSKRVLGMPCQYLPQMADIATSKEIEREQDSEFGTTLLTLDGVKADPLATRTILEIMIRNRGEKWEKEKEKILGTYDRVIKMQQQQQQRGAPAPALGAGAGTGPAAAGRSPEAVPPGTPPAPGGQ